MYWVSIMSKPISIGGKNPFICTSCKSTINLGHNRFFDK